jgi:hypothetical protein
MNATKKNSLFNRATVALTWTAFTFVLTMFLLGCADDGDDNDYEMLNGVWDRGDIVVTFNGSSAVFTEIKSNSDWQSVLNNGSIRIGDKKFKDITGNNLKWTCQERTFNQLTYVSEGWEDCTITMSADGQNITVVTPNTTNPTTTYTKVQ